MDTHTELTWQETERQQGEKSRWCKAKPTHDEEEGQARMRGSVCSSVSFYRYFSLLTSNQKATLHWFTCRRALPALYFSCKEWCWIRCPGRCRCYSLHLGKGLGWDRAFGSLKCWTDTLFSLWPGEKKTTGTMQTLRKCRTSGALSFCLLILHKSLP